MNKALDNQVILAVDDAPENLDVVKNILKGEYTVKAAPSGAIALKIAQTQKVDLILLDIMMPEMDGYEVCHRLKADEKTRNIPILFLTVKGDEADEKKGFELGAVDYIQKPVSPAILKARVKTHLALYDQNRALETLVEKRTEELRETHEALARVQKMETVGQLAGGIAHDFNNLLGIIQGNLELVREMTKGEPAICDRVEKALQGAQRGSELTRRLLKFSRKSTRAPSVLNPNDFIGSTHELVEKALAHSIDIKMDFSDDLQNIEADPGDFEDAILNLSLNSRDAMPNGGLLHIKTENIVIDNSNNNLHPKVANGDYVLITVSDTGVGMSEEVREKALEPFFTTKGEDKGTGLGLAMVYGFIKRSKGHLTISSEVGEGTVIRLYFPSTPKSSTATETEQTEKANIPGGNETILVVDDEDELLDIAKNQLQSLGYTVYTASSYDAALAVLEKQNDIDLLLSDVVMPGGKDGYDLALKIRDLYPQVKSLLVSGFSREKSSSEPEINSFFTQLSSKMLQKPYQMADLACGVRHTLNEPQEQVNTSPELFMLVDDDKDLGEVMEFMLKHSGVKKIVRFHDPLKALDWLKANAQSVKFILSDLNMPKCNGYALAEEVRTNHPALSDKLALMSAITDVGTIVSEDDHDIPIHGKPVTFETAQGLLSEINWTF